MSPLETLFNMGVAAPAEAPYAAQIDLSEHQNLQVEFPKEVSSEAIAEIATAFTHPSVRGLVSLSVQLGGRNRIFVSIKTTSIVGFASALLGNSPIFVRVRPKVATRRFLELAAVAGRLPQWKGQTLVGHDQVSTMIEWTLRAFIFSAEGLVSRAGIRATHLIDREVLRSRLRGKLLVSPFISNLAKGRPDRIPCEFSALRLDNKFNRILRWGVHLAETLAITLSIQDVGATLNKLRMAFANVSLEKPTVRDLDQTTSLPPNLRHYQEPLRIARLLILAARLDATAGATPAVSVALDMNLLYEEAFWVLFKRVEPRAIRKPSWLFPLAECATGKPVKSLRFEPDVLVPGSTTQRPLIIDTKWKDALRSSPTSIDVPEYMASVVRPRTLDIYQAIAYALTIMRDSGVSECAAVLAYPSLKPVPDITHRLNFDSIDLKLFLIGWNISEDLVEEMSNIRDRLMNFAAFATPATAAVSVPEVAA